MQIQTLEEKTGLDRATIRFYEKEGLLSPNRLQNGYRDYTDKHYMDLMRIKLLRQTGVSLETIKQLIDGKVSLDKVLTDQLDVINKCEDGLIRARFLCTMMLQDHTTYHSMNPFRYFDAKEAPAIENTGIIDTPYEEIRYTEAHPFRRYLARYLDALLTSAVIMLIAVVFMRIRPFTDIHNSLISVISVLLCVPINALCIYLFGATPGKLATGIFVRDIDGKKLAFGAAIKREWDVLRFGCGFYIPIYSWICLIKSYKTHTKGQELCWDYYCDVQYDSWSAKRIISLFLLLIVSLTAINYSAFDLYKPRFRSDLLTIEQFADNYNDYAEQNEMLTFLSPEGEWYTNNVPGTVIIETDPIVEGWNFVADQTGYLQEIEYELQTDSSFFFLNQRKISLVIYTAVMSKPDGKLSKANESTSDLAELEYMLANGTSEAEYEYCGVTVKWKVNQNDIGDYRYTISFNVVL